MAGGVGSPMGQPDQAADEVAADEVATLERPLLRRRMRLLRPHIASAPRPEACEAPLSPGRMREQGSPERAKPASPVDNCLMEPAAEPGGCVEEPAAEPIGLAKPGPETQAGALSLALVVARLVKRSTRASLRRWRDVPASAAEQGRRRLGTSCSPRVSGARVRWQSREEKQEQLTVELLAAWLQLAMEGRARRAVRSVCSHFRSRVLLGRAWSGLAQNLRLRRARGSAIAEVFETWTVERRAERVLSAIDVWRRRATKGSIRRRRGAALVRWVTSSRLRLWLLAWHDVARRDRALAAGVARRERAIHTDVLLGSLALWRHSAVALRRVRLRRKTTREHQTAAAWSAWRAFAVRSRSGADVARSRLGRRQRDCVRQWLSLCLATGLRTTRLIGFALRRWRKDVAVPHVGRVLAKRHLSALADRVLRQWRVILGLARRAEAVHFRSLDSCASRALRQWSALRASVNFADGRLASDAVKAWRAGVAERADDRALLEQGSCLLERHLRAGLCDALDAWSAWAAERRELGEKRATLQASLRRRAGASTLRSWRQAAEAEASRYESLERSAIAVEAMVSASRWSQAQGVCETWAAYARARRQRRGGCPPEAAPGAAGSSMGCASSPPARDLAARVAPSAAWGHAGRLSRAACVKPAAALRWLRWTVALWLGAVTSLPWLQWALSLWRGAVLRTELQRLRWWSFALRRAAFGRIVGTRKLRVLHAWRALAPLPLRRELAPFYNSSDSGGSDISRGEPSTAGRGDTFASSAGGATRAAAPAAAAALVAGDGAIAFAAPHERPR